MSVSSARTAVAMLALSAAGFVGLIQYEGYTDNAVIPIPGDVPTIGFGSTEGVKLGDHITPPKAVERALRDVGKHNIGTCITAPLFQYEYDAYTQLAYNIGMTNFCGSSLVRKVNSFDYIGGCAEISKWDKAGGRQIPGLTTRRAKERAKCEGRQ